MLKPQLIRKKSVRKCTCKTTELREEEEELNTLEPEKVSEKNWVDSNGTDYFFEAFVANYSRDECNAKIYSWTDPGWCLEKCSKKKKCPTGLTCLKVCLLDRGFKAMSEKQTSQRMKTWSHLKIVVFQHARKILIAI